MMVISYNKYFIHFHSVIITDRAITEKKSAMLMCNLLSSKDEWLEEAKESIQYLQDQLVDFSKDQPPEICPICKANILL